MNILKILLVLSLCIFLNSQALAKDVNYNKEIEIYNNFIKVNDKDIEAYLNRGNIYKLNEKYDKAIEDYSKVIKLDPKNFYAYFNRGNIFEKIKKNDFVYEKFI